MHCYESWKILLTKMCHKKCLPFSSLIFILISSSKIAFHPTLIQTKTKNHRFWNDQKKKKRYLKNKRNIDSQILLKQILLCSYIHGVKKNRFCSYMVCISIELEILSHQINNFSIFQWKIYCFLMLVHWKQTNKKRCKFYCNLWSNLSLPKKKQFLAFVL